jgi:hypothetical protein
MDSPVSPEDEIWFLRVGHHISNAIYYADTSVTSGYSAGMRSQREAKYFYVKIS